MFKNILIDIYSKDFNYDFNPNHTDTQTDCTDAAEH